jgi:hypothetical protein
LVVARLDYSNAGEDRRHLFVYTFNDSRRKLDLFKLHPHIRDLERSFINCEETTRPYFSREDIQDFNTQFPKWLCNKYVRNSLEPQIISKNGAIDKLHCGFLEGIVDNPKMMQSFPPTGFVVGYRKD